MALDLTRYAAPPLSESLLRCADVCERTLLAFRGAERTTGRAFFAALIAAVAGLQRAAVPDEDERARTLALSVGAKLAREAAVTVRLHGIDPALLRCAEACERAARLCDDAVRALSGSE